MSNTERLETALDLAIEFANLKQRLEDVSRIASAYRWHGVATHVEDCLEVLEMGADQMTGEVTTLRNRLYVEGVRP